MRTFLLRWEKEAYKKTLDLTIYDGRLKNNQEYTLTVQVGEQDESGVLPDILSYSNKKAFNYRISAGKVAGIPLYMEKRFDYS